METMPHKLYISLLSHQLMKEYSICLSLFEYALPFCFEEQVYHISSIEYPNPLQD
jgi:hypothetical protein